MALFRSGWDLQDTCRDKIRPGATKKMPSDTHEAREQLAGTPMQRDHPGLVRQLGIFHATMIVMGGIVGSGIFMNPYVVAQQVRTPFLILGAWAAGGVIALLGAFVYAELAARRPQVGGQYAYIREAYHPAAAFLYGWVLLLVIQTGGMAAVAVTFARYFIELTRVQLADWLVASLALAIAGGLRGVGLVGSRLAMVESGRKLAGPENLSGLPIRNGQRA